MNNKWANIEISDEILLEVSRRLEKLPVFNGSHRKEEANQVGCIGEVVVEKWLQKHSVDFESKLKVTSHDYLVNGSLRLEVKTKDRTVPPKSNYECTLPDYNHEHQDADYFIFVSLLRDKAFDGQNPLKRFKKAYVLGGIELSEFEKNKVFWKKGQKDPSNGTTFWTDCWNVYINQLNVLSVVKSKLLPENFST